MDAQREERMRQVHRTSLITCTSMPLTVPVFVAMARWLELNGYRPGVVAPGFTLEIAVFFVLAVGAAVASVYARRSLEKLPLRRLSRLDRGAEEWGEDAVRPADALLGGLYVGAIVAFALAEVGALLGFVYFVMGGTWFYFAVLVVPSIVGWFFNLPRLDVWRVQIEALKANPGGPI